MGDLARAIGQVIDDHVAGIGGDLEMEIEEGANTASNRRRLKNLLKIDDLLQRAHRLAQKSNL